MSRRRSTVHDAAALRLHPSGARVNDVQNAARSVVTVKTKTPTLSRRLPRGNWIASDAGGDGRIIKRRKISEGKIADIDVGKTSTADGQGEAEAAAGTKERLVKVYKDTRANRRVAFENDLTFLAAPSSVSTGNATHLQPSSDFLKCIHYFASQYYGSSGQLFDSAGDYRKVKEKRRQRMLQAAASGSREPETSQDEDGNEVEDQQVESDDFSRDVSPTSESTRVRKEKEKVKSGTIKKKRRDMYKAFDGSALLCIGTLLQSHIASSLADNMPDSWENDDLADGSEGSRGGTESDLAQLEHENGL